MLLVLWTVVTTYPAMLGLLVQPAVSYLPCVFSTLLQQNGVTNPCNCINELISFISILYVFLSSSLSMENQPLVTWKNVIVESSSIGAIPIVFGCLSYHVFVDRKSFS